MYVCLSVRTCVFLFLSVCLSEHAHVSVCLSEHAHVCSFPCACSDRQTDRNINTHVLTDRQTDRQCILARVCQVRIQRGDRGSGPPLGKSQVIWVSIRNKLLDPPPLEKVGPPPLENVGPPLEP